MSANGVVNIHGKDYKTVALRVSEFREEFSIKDGWSVTADVVKDEDGIIVVKAYIKDQNDRVIATGLAEERRGTSQINRTSALENCETSAIGRALAAAGYGGSDYASANEVENAIHQQSEPTEETTDETEQTWSFDAAMALAVDKLHQYARPLVKELGQDRKSLVGFVGEIASRPPFEFIDELNLDDIRAVYKAAKDAMSQEIDRRVAEANGA